ncbi:methylenetetrahydrofolate--tRNA-(uracil(54)-C(5))-methyltransferase (FADH(2)-oxidizing) TrmFO [Roseospira visakhapatnamensis]|uniref:Methylenetetrahydrofolate--tRNA-(uracil-5-)-methyltransferase TrmFO n=1 Tax=Roseospira visakhapatnamensis TaxID=390880 RepID=A0A7W6W918_9PROT|nr:methylenetetrahydrofolate--tRNA-(uracil(54)-C(5))-methyltransferase (FADH(2)-oxidizing) TrmFO [Roseospira visakhapatnamensis]MBB4264996.1 methylenetetrahydrofolate--tRNA-(uracil-5-)-methyltransferase [Roseospira visakhapatnamensis]
MTHPDPVSRVRIVGGGLAGSEAAWQCARHGLSVDLVEMRPHRSSEAHVTDDLAELVCSNSFRSDDAEGNAVGLLHAEMRQLDSLILACADAHRVPAGGALAVDREAFSRAVQARLEAHPRITVTRAEITSLPDAADGPVIIATGPLTAGSLAEAIRAETGEAHLAFFDAIAPIVHRDSIDMEVAWFQSRYDKGEGADYINCPMDRDQYEAFLDALLAAETVAFKDWEGTPYFEGCLPIEVMAERGRETLAHGPMKPVGLTNPRQPDRKPHAIVQLRQDNALGTLYNMVGFQTKLRHGEQARIFRMIPGLHRADFARLGGIHRNTFLNSPRLLDSVLRLKSRPHIRFAGQMTGCEGYVESAAVGLLAGLFAGAEALGADPLAPPATTALGALLAHITTPAHADTFQPMNVNFGLFPELPPEMIRVGKRKLRGRERKAQYGRRAATDLTAWMARLPPAPVAA